MSINHVGRSRSETGRSRSESESAFPTSRSVRAGRIRAHPYLYHKFCDSQIVNRVVVVYFSQVVVIGRVRIFFIGRVVCVFVIDGRVWSYGQNTLFST